jgi:hypothetical protein
MSKGQGIWLNLPTFLDLTVGPPRRLYVFNPDTGALELVGGTGHGGSLLLRPGGLQHAVETVVLPGDPPDPVMLGGDYVYVRRMQPDFTLSPTGDLTLVEGA